VARTRDPNRLDAIVAAALASFTAAGYRGARMSDVAAAAGVSKALIYEHFSSKQNLHDTLISVQAGELFGRLAAAADPELAPEQRLRGGVDVFFGFVEERREAWRALFRDAADPHLGDVVEHVQRQATAAIVDLMLAGADPQGGQQDVEMVAQMLSGAVQALANWWYDHQDVPRAVLVDRVMAFAWLGLGRLSGGAD
jgi:AcrR family transcriptional regulator